MLPRVLEPEIMDSLEEAVDYDSMDHEQVNRQFVDDFLRAAEQPGAWPLSGEVLDLGTGTARIPILLCRTRPGLAIVAVDAAAGMLDVAQKNVQAAGLGDSIRLERFDAKSLPLNDDRFSAVISNSIVHHIAQPLAVLRQACRVLRRGGLLFFRDLLRPADHPTLTRLVESYAGQANDRQRQMFADSLHAALNLEEIRQAVGQCGFDPQAVQATSDRHWTWSARKP